MSDLFKDHHKKFCQLMLLCIEGPVKATWFLRAAGLCINFSDYTLAYALENFQITREREIFVRKMETEFGTLLIDEYGSKMYPFNNHNSDQFYYEHYRYRNPQRLAHLRKYAE